MCHKFRLNIFLAKILPQLKPGFHFDLFCLLLFVLVFSTNKKQKRAMQFLLILSHKQELTSTEEHQKGTNSKWKHAPKTKTSNKKQQRAFLIPIFIHLLQLWTFGRWLTSRAMRNQKDQQRATKSTKSNEKQCKATKSSEKQREAARSSKKHRRATKRKNGHRSLKNQNGKDKAQKVQMETTLKRSL